MLLLTKWWPLLGVFEVSLETIWIKFWTSSRFTVHVYVVVWFFCCGLIFFKPVSIFRTGLKFFKPVYFFFCQLSYKKWENITLHYIPLSILSFFRWVPPDLLSSSYSTPSPKSPLINSRFHFLSCTHQDLNRQPLDLLSTVITTWPWKQWVNCFNYQFFTPSPSHINFNLFINTHKF